MRSHLQTIGGVPALIVNGEAIPQTAYMTYYTERGCYADFQKIGYELFSVSLSFSSQTINEATQSPPFTKGIYDAVYDGGKPNYTYIDRAMEKILKACPNACIFPRVNVSLPSQERQRLNTNETRYIFVNGVAGIVIIRKNKR